MFLGDYTLVNRFTLGDPALRPYANVQNDLAKMARHSLSEGTVAITGPDEWSMVPMHPDQLKVGPGRRRTLADVALVAGE